MSDEAKLTLCDDCGLPIGSGPYYHTGGRISGCHQALMAEVATLRAALDQERAKVVALREVIEASGEWLPNSRGKLIFQFGGGWIANDETLALLSGRGEGNGNG